MWLSNGSVCLLEVVALDANYVYVVVDSMCYRLIELA